MPIRRYTPAELRRFLRAIDAHLRRKLTLKIMGGGAIAVGYGVDYSTADFDTFETNLRPLAGAIERAQKETGLDIAVSRRGGDVGDRPWNSDDRLVRVMPRLKRLTIYVLEKHDLALSKAVRGYEHDISGVAKLHQQRRLDKDVLLARYLDEMGHAIGDPVRLDHNFTNLIDRLFGEIAAAGVTEILGRRRRRRR